MKRLPLITRIAALAAIVAGTGLALAMPAGADVSSLSPPEVAAVQVGSPATVGARGAVVTVPVIIVCAPGTSGTVFVELTQAHGGAIAHGAGYMESGPCTGAFQTLNVTVTPTAEPFRRGTAFAEADFSVCSFSCGTVSDQREITIVR